MSAARLDTKYVVKPWGRPDIGSFSNPEGERIGEIWFDGPTGRHPPLLVKYIFTSEKLSIQVHPDDQQGQAAGLAGGKSECWYVLAAEPGARLGIGTTVPLDGAQLRAAALDGTLEELMDWKPVQPGSFYYIPAGTVHAIGAGVTLVEVQQNNDVTYRLFDYGRPRELHLEDGVAVSQAGPYALPERIVPMGCDIALVDGASAPFRLDMLSWEVGNRTLTAQLDLGWFIPLSGAGTINGQPWEAGQCWLVEGQADIEVARQGSILWANLP